MTLPQLCKIFTPPEVIQCATLLQSSCQLGGINVKIFVTWVTQIPEVIRQIENSAAD